jgi:hypothetical protein
MEAREVPDRAPYASTSEKAVVPEGEDNALRRGVNQSFSL